MKLKNRILTALIITGIAVTTIVPAFAEEIDDTIVRRIDHHVKCSVINTVINGKDQPLHGYIIDGKAYIRERDFVAILGFKQQRKIDNDVIDTSDATYNPTLEYEFRPRDKRILTFGKGQFQRHQIAEYDLMYEPILRNGSKHPNERWTDLRYQGRQVRLYDDNKNFIDFLEDELVPREVYRRISDLPAAARGMAKYNNVPPVAVEVKYNPKTKKIIINSTMTINKDMPGVKIKNTAQNTEPRDIYNIGSEKFTKEIVRLINLERKKNGAVALVIDENLIKVADERMMLERREKKTGNALHILKGEKVQDTAKRILNKKISVAENAYVMEHYRQTTPEEVVQAWINTPQYHKNMIAKNRKKIAVLTDFIDIHKENGKGIDTGVTFALFE